MQDEVYTALAEYLDKMPAGAPSSDESLEIQRMLFTPEEAALAVKLPFVNTTLEEISGTSSVPHEKLEAMLDVMTSKGRRS
jgi:hypothetical protein